MPVNYLEAPGAPIGLAALRHARSASLARFLGSQINPYAELVDIRGTSEGSEIIVFDVDVELSQVSAFDIRPRERLAVIFEDGGALNPEVLALRQDFPYVPHLNPRDEEIPRSICLYEESADELRLTWTPANFVERVRWWLSETASGTLHGQDQPLEPILLGDFPPLILPSDFLEAMRGVSEPRHLEIERRRAGNREVYLARWGRPGTSCAAVVLVARPHVHGVIRLHPGNLKRLSQLLADVGLDVIGELRTRMAQWELVPNLLNAPPIIVVALPKQRKPDGEVETVETWAFLVSKSVGDLGAALGILQRIENSYGRVVGGAPDEKMIESTTAGILNPTYSLSRSRAAALNGTHESPMNIAAIGLGALGSHVVNNLVRAGFGTWTGVDHDIFLPHNAARHELDQNAVGSLKACGMQARLNAILDVPAMPSIIDVDVLRAGPRDAEVERALSGADAILDFSASLSVARKLAYYPKSDTRRCSVFLNPSGSDLVLLCEDANRLTRLDWLEFQYYRELTANSELASHFTDGPVRIRYARSCRDLASRVPQHLVATHGGIASQALQACLLRPEAVVRIWHTTPGMNVRAYDVEAPPVIDIEVDGWRVCTDKILMKKLQKLRKAKLPNETGGVLLGSFDQERRIAYLADAIPSPPDSEEWPTLYIRGKQGLDTAVNQAGAKTAGQLQYMGEWHTHPNTCSTNPSDDDRQVMLWLAEHTARDDNPAIMIIVGEGAVRIFLGSSDNSTTIERARR